MRSTPSFYGELFCSRRSFTAQCLIYVSSTDVFLFRPSAKVPSTQCLQYSWKSIRGHRNSVHHPRCRQFPSHPCAFLLLWRPANFLFGYSLCCSLYFACTQRDVHRTIIVFSYCCSPDVFYTFPFEGINKKDSNSDALHKSTNASVIVDPPGSCNKNYK